MAKNWTDERLEERFDTIDRRFDAVDRRFDRVDAELRELRGEMNARFDSLQRTMMQFAGALIVALVAALVGIVIQI